MSGGKTLREVFSGAARDYAPLSARAVERILQFDQAAGFGPRGTQPNRNRFYAYLVRRGSDVEVRTVAVKARRRHERPAVKEVARASVDDPWIHLIDVAHMGICGYVVDWSPEGVGRPRGWSYGGRWSEEPYGLRCMWKINAPVVNPGLLERTRRFRWSDWKSSGANILDYLKVFNVHPEVEFLSKQGLGRFCTKVSVVRKLKADRKFRQFFMRNAEEIRRGHVSVAAILKAYGRGIPISDALREIDARAQFRHCRLPGQICAVRALAYVKAMSMRIGTYTDYLHDCQRLGMDLSDTKVSFPRQFKRRQRMVQDQVAALRRREDEQRMAKLDRTMAAVAEQWGWLECRRGSFRMVIPRTEGELVREGREMKNCLGQYADRISRGDSVVVFVRHAQRPEEAFVAVEYDAKRGKVAQCYGISNGRPPKAVRDFVDRVFEGRGVARMKSAA